MSSKSYVEMTDVENIEKPILQRCSAIHNTDEYNFKTDYTHDAATLYDVLNSNTVITKSHIDTNFNSVDCNTPPYYGPIYKSKYTQQARKDIEKSHLKRS